MSTLGYRFSGHALRQRRLNSGQPIERLALDVERSTRTIINYESGIVMPSADMVGRLAAALNCTPADLYAVSDVTAVSA